MRRFNKLTNILVMIFLCSNFVRCTDVAPVTSNPDSDSIAANLTLTSINNLNTNNGIINSHADEWQNSVLEMNYRTYVELEYPTLATASANYPRIKKMANGNYIMFYQKGKSAWNIYFNTSNDLINWSTPTTLFAQVAAYRSNGTSDTRCFSSCDAVVLQNGDILAFAAFRLNNGYKYEPENNGIMMRRSSDNGKTWSNQQVIYTGTNWEPFALQLPTGEIQVYFTDCEPNSGDSGTSLLRSLDNGVHWTFSGKIIRQQSGIATDNSNKVIYTDQMPSAIILNGSNDIAVALESRFVSTYYISMAYSKDNWSNYLTGTEEGPTDRQSNILSGAGPYLKQFFSGETVLSYSQSNYFNLKIGDSIARNFGASYLPFKGTGYWGSTEIINNHALVAAMPYTYTENGTDNYKMQIGQFILNHRIDADYANITIDGNNNDWKNYTDAFFLGSESTSQATFRFTQDENYIYVLIERLDYNLTNYDKIKLWLQSGDGNGNPLQITLTPNITNKTIDVDNSNIISKSTIKGTFNDTNTDDGYLVEMAIPKTLVNIVNNKLLFNASLFEKGITDNFNGLNSTNYGNWLPIVFRNKTLASVINEKYLSKINFYQSVGDNKLNFNDVLSKIEIYSISGQIIRKALDSNSINVAGLSGIYILKVLFNQGKDLNEKIIIR